MISAQQEANLAEANARAKKKQDRVNPHVVNIEDGRLMPNTPRLRIHPQYRVYTGPKDADAAGRLQWLEGQTRHGAPRIVNSKEAEDQFDVGTATADEIVMFANEHFGAVLDPKSPMKTLRSQLVLLAEKAEAQERAQSQGSDLS